MVKTLYTTLVFVCLEALTTAGAAPLQTLAESHCVPLARSGVTFALDEEWKPFTDETRVCPLRRSGGREASVFLVSVFARAYFDRHPDVKDIPAFPRPRLVDREGACLARLAELYPFDPPRDLTLRYGAWKANVPTEIRVLVANPAMGGDYELPRLRWDADAKSYRSAADPSTPRSTPCPT